MNAFAFPTPLLTHDPAVKLQFVGALSIIANRKGITLAQLSIAWVGALGDHMIPLPGSS